MNGLTGETYSITASHSSEKAVDDLDDLLDRLTSYPIPYDCSRVCAHYYATLEAESERCCAMGNLYRTVWVGMIVGHCSEP
jgi:hypothetical protein